MNFLQTMTAVNAVIAARCIMVQFQEEDVEKDAGHLGITVEEFKKLYLKRDEISGDYDTKPIPVTFFRRMEPADWENADQKAAGISVYKSAGTSVESVQCIRSSICMSGGF